MMEAQPQELTPFDGGQQEETSLVQITKGEVDMQVATAKQFTRSVTKSIKDAVTLATLDQKTAESCFYALPRKNKLIEGPSVRLAEIMANTWGNLRCEARVIEEGRKHVTAQATSWDMERNILVRIEAKRRITDKNGNRYNQDMILMTENAAISIALRNSIFRVIPRSIVDRVYGEARRVALGKAKTMEQRRTAAFFTFSKMGVTEERILTVLDRQGVDDVNAEDLSKLLGLLNALRDGATTIEDVFPPIQPESGENRSGETSTPKSNGSKTDEVLQRIKNVVNGDQMSIGEKGRQKQEMRDQQDTRPSDQELSEKS